MSSTEVGTRVIAIQQVQENKVFAFGAGVYEGDYPRPGTEDMPTGRDLQLVTHAIKNSATPEYRDKMKDIFSNYEDMAVAEGLRTREEADIHLQKALADWDERVARPLEEKVADLWASMRQNPRIKLDNDRGYVWGFESWWGPEDSVLAKYPVNQFLWIQVDPQYNTAA